MKSINLKEAERLLEHYRLVSLGISGRATINYRFLWVDISIPISKETLNLCLKNEKETTRKQLEELGVEVDE